MNGSSVRGSASVGRQQQPSRSRSSVNDDDDNSSSEDDGIAPEPLPLPAVVENGGFDDEEDDDDYNDRCQEEEEEEEVEVDEREIHAVAQELYIPYPAIMTSIRRTAAAQQQHQLHHGRSVSQGAGGITSGYDGAKETDVGAALLRSSGRYSPGMLRPITSVRVSIANIDAYDDDDADDGGRNAADEDGYGVDSFNTNHNGGGGRASSSYQDQHTGGGGGGLLASSSSLGGGAAIYSMRSNESQPLRRASGVSQHSVVVPPPKKRLVQFAQEIESVHVYEVDNSLFISIEYSRPLFGWVLLLIAIVTGVAVDVMNTYVMATGPSNNIYAHVAWSSIGQAAIVVCLLLPAWYILVKPTRVETRFLTTLTGAATVIATGLLGALMTVSYASTAHLMQQWRGMALSAVHAPLIVLFGKVFRNTVYREELIGSGVLLGSFLLSTLPSDVVAVKWQFAEILSLSSGIYVASYLFLAVKARSHRVSTPVVAALVSFLQLVSFVIICGVIGIPFTVRDHDHSGVGSTSSGGASDMAGADNGVFGFAENDARTARWLAASICSTVSLLAFLMTLRFIPPITVSVAMCLQQLASRFAAFLLLFNVPTAPWPVCPVAAPSMFMNTPAPVPMSQEDLMLCGNGGSTNILRNILFSVGSCVAVVSGGYLVYVSSIKRSRVDRLLKHLNNRKVPKNPYQSRHGAPKSPSVASSVIASSYDYARQAIALASPHHHHAQHQQVFRSNGRAPAMYHGKRTVSLAVQPPPVVSHHLYQQDQQQQQPRRIGPAHSHTQPTPVTYGGSHSRGGVDSDNYSLSTMDASTPTNR